MLFNSIVSTHQDKHIAILLNDLLKLDDRKFLNLVAIRLNQPLSQDQIKEWKISDEELRTREYWTEEYLIDELFLQIAQIKEIIKHEGKTITVHKYYSQALRLRKWIPIAKPTPEFTITCSDLTPRINAELKALDKKCSEYLLKQAAGRIFENIDSREYHLSIAPKLKVRLDR